MISKKQEDQYWVMKNRGSHFENVARLITALKMNGASMVIIKPDSAETWESAMKELEERTNPYIMNSQYIEAHGFGKMLFLPGLREEQEVILREFMEKVSEHDGK